MKKTVEVMDVKMKGEGGRVSGPMARRLTSIGGIKMVSVGAFGEVGDGMGGLLGMIAAQRAGRVYRALGFEEFKEALPTCRAQAVRKFGIAAVRFRAGQIREAFERYLDQGTNQGQRLGRIRMVKEARKRAQELSEDHVLWNSESVRGGIANDWVESRLFT